MNEIVLLLLGVGAIFLITCSIALLALGRMIDRYPQGNESARERSIASPIESTKIAVVLLWTMFGPGAWVVFQENKYVLIAGITILFAVCLFMFTTLVFSFAVLNAMKNRRRQCSVVQTPGLQTARPVEISPGEAPLAKNAPKPMPDFMAAMLAKKD